METSQERREVTYCERVGLGSECVRVWSFPPSLFADDGLASCTCYLAFFYKDLVRHWRTLEKKKIFFILQDTRII